MAGTKRGPGDHAAQDPHGPAAHARTQPSMAPRPEGISGTRPRTPTRGKSVELALARTMASEEMYPRPHVQEPGAAPEPLAVGDVIGDRYVIEQHISSGGFGAVYRASDKQISHHQVALKLLHTPAADEEARNNAMRELKLIASVSHPSVVQFKDYGWHEGRLWFAMPWYDGQTLDQRYAGFPMTRAEARPIFERLAMGLAAMHEVGIEHHDIKPENIFLADIAGFEGGLPVLLDLGIAGEHGEGPRGLTLDYAAPETAARALGEEVKVGTAADVFSLALVLRNMLEPREEPQGEFEPIALLHQRATQPVEGFRHRGFRFMQPQMERWLSSDPYERPTAQELAEELAILTEPEEKRASRMRLLKRLLPVVAVAAVLVTVLWNQVREQKTQLTVQQELLSEQQQQAEVLREQTADQLGKLESQMAEIGSQRRQLQKAIGIARDLDKRLEQTERQREQLRRRARQLGGERDGLKGDLEKLGAEHTALQATRDSLVRERDGLTRQRDGLVKERDGLTRERQQLEQRVDALSTAVQSAKERLSGVEAERDRAGAQQKVLQKEIAALEKERDQLDRTRTQLEKDKARLEKDKARLEARMKAYERRLERLRTRGADKVNARRKAAGGDAAEADGAGAKP